MAVTKFTDGTGVEWVIRPTLDSVRRFEERAGVGLFEAVLDAVVDDAQDEKLRKGIKSKSKEAIELEIARARQRAIKMAKRVFGTLGTLGAFLYESISPQRRQKLPDFTEFCKRIETDQVRSAMIIAMRALLDFFPDVDEGEEREDGGGPLPRGRGETSSALPES